MNEFLAKNYVASNDIFGYPQSYKELELYPIKVKDKKIADLFYHLMTYPKNYIADKRVIHMSYLKFAIVFSEDQRKASADIETLMKHITRKDSVIVQVMELDADKPNEPENIRFRIMIDENIEISEEYFEDIREIILEQNGSSIEYVNQYHPEMEAKLMDLYKSNNITFEDQIFTLSTFMKKNVEEIGEYTLYQLQDIFDRMIVLKQFDLYQPLIVSGQITMKGSNTIQSYLYHRERKDRYASILTSSDSFREKIKDIM
jgi:hypothetical protein